MGESILSHYDNSNRGENRSRNDRGVEIVSITLSIEPEEFEDSLRSFATNQGFDMIGLDLVISELGERARVREGFSFFSGEDPALTPAEVCFDYRRRLLIINGVPGPEQWRILYSTNFYLSREAEAFRNIIDSVGPAVPNPEVPIVSIRSTATGVELTWTWEAPVERAITVERSSNLLPGHWELLREGVSKDGVYRMRVPASSSPGSFFRAKASPPWPR